MKPRANILHSLEAQIAIVVACIPALRPIFTRRKGNTPLRVSSYSESSRRLHGTGEASGYGRRSQADIDGMFSGQHAKASKVLDPEQEIQMDDMDGIKKTVDVEVGHNRR